MADDQIEITFKCLKCGGTVLSLPDDYTDDSIASCKSCGQEFGTYGEIKAKARDEALAAVTARLNESFKGLKGWKVK